jgi:hypothetical protein
MLMMNLKAAAFGTMYHDGMMVALMYRNTSNKPRNVHAVSAHMKLGALYTTVIAAEGQHCA